jgi:hypothetical protein
MFNKNTAAVFFALSCSVVQPAYAIGQEDSNDCSASSAEFCERAGSCAIQGATWYQYVTIDKVDRFDTQGWPGLCDMVHVSLVQNTCEPLDSQTNVTAYLSGTTYAEIPSISGPLACGDINNIPAAVEIDVLPGDAANKIYPNKGGKFPVAVLSGAEFDATQVDPGTVRFGLGEAAPADPPIISDVDGLHGADTTLTFWTEETGILCNDTEVSLTGDTYAGDAIQGSDTIDASDCVSGGCHQY